MQPEGFVLDAIVDPEGCGGAERGSSLPLLPQVGNTAEPKTLGDQGSEGHYVAHRGAVYGRVPTPHQGKTFWLSRWHVGFRPHRRWHTQGGPRLVEQTALRPSGLP